MLQVNAFIDVRLFYRPLTITTLPKTDTLQQPEAVCAPSSPGGTLTTLLRDLLILDILSYSNCVPFSSFFSFFI